MSNGVYALSNNGKYILQCSVEENVNSEYIFTFYVLNVDNGKIVSKFFEWKSKFWDPGMLGMISPKSNYCFIKVGTNIVGFDLNTLQTSKYYRPGNRICSISKDEKYLILGGANTGSGLEVLILDNNIMDLGKKKSIPIGKEPDEVPTKYALMSNDNKYIILGDIGMLKCYNFENFLSVMPTSVMQKNYIYPNPTKDKIILSNPLNHQINTLTAYDILGRTYQLSANGNEVDVSALAAGRYFLKVGLGDGSFLDFGFVKE